MAKNQKNKLEQGTSWGVITLLLIFCFYIGIPLMLRKLHKDKENMIENAKKTTIVGWIIFGLGCFYLLMGLTGELVVEDGSSVVSGVIMMLVLCCGGGYAIVKHAKKYKNLGMMHERYLTIISNSPTGSLHDIADAIGENVEVTTQNIQRLIDVKMLENSYIDKTHCVLVSPIVGRWCHHQTDYRNHMYKSRVVVPKVKTVKCHNCGGVNNVIEGDNHTCDYCGFTIKDE